MYLLTRTNGRIGVFDISSQADLRNTEGARETVLKLIRARLVGTAPGSEIISLQPNATSQGLTAQGLSYLSIHMIMHYCNHVSHLL